MGSNNNIVYSVEDITALTKEFNKKPSVFHNENPLMPAKESEKPNTLAVLQDRFADIEEHIPAILEK